MQCHSTSFYTPARMVRTVEPLHMDILRHIFVVTSANGAMEQEFRARKVVSDSQGMYDVYLDD